LQIFNSDLFDFYWTELLVKFTCSYSSYIYMYYTSMKGNARHMDGRNGQPWVFCCLFRDTLSFTVSKFGLFNGCTLWTSANFLSLLLLFLYLPCLLFVVIWKYDNTNIASWIYDPLREDIQQSSSCGNSLDLLKCLFQSASSWPCQ